MPKRRGNSEGTVYFRAERNRWYWQCTAPDGSRPTGSARTKTEALAAMREKQSELGMGGSAAPKPSVTAFVSEWLEGAKHAKAAKTYLFYRDITRLHILPQIGRKRIDAVNATDIERIIRIAREAGRAPSTLKHIRTVANTVFNAALKRRLILHNPVAAVSTPAGQGLRKEDERYLTLTQARAVVAGTVGEPHHAEWVVALFMGLREGEIIGLRWQDVDFARKRLHVRQTVQKVKTEADRPAQFIFKEPKTAKSRRTLAIPARVESALMAQRERVKQAREKAGNRWEDHDLVFPSNKGTPLDRRNLLRAWTNTLAKLELPHRTFHAARHTAASLLIAEGLSLKHVQEALGHAHLSTTADIYGHLSDGAREEVADAMERMFAAD